MPCNLFMHKRQIMVHIYWAFYQGTRKIIHMKICHSNLIKKALVAGPIFHGYVDQIAASFHANGVDAKAITYKPSALISSIRRGLSLNLIFKRNEAQKYMKTIPEQHDTYALNRFLHALKLVVQEWKPDVLLLIRPDLIPIDFFFDLRNKSPNTKLTIWSTDPIQRFTVDREMLQACHAVFLYDKFDVSYVNTCKAQGISLPVGFDGRAYFPIHDVKQDLHKVSFVGRLSQDRLVDLAVLPAKIIMDKTEYALYNGYRNYLVRVKLMMQINKPPLYAYSDYTKVNACRAADIYRRTAINLNIHQYGTRQGFNPRFFEIPAAGGFQIAKYLPGMEEFFEPGKEIVYYQETSDLCELVKRYLKDGAGRTRISKLAAKRAHEEYSFKCRVRTMIRHLS